MLQQMGEWGAILCMAALAIGFALSLGLDTLFVKMVGEHRLLSEAAVHVVIAGVLALLLSLASSPIVIVGGYAVVAMIAMSAFIHAVVYFAAKNQAHLHPSY